MRVKSLPLYENQTFVVFEISKFGKFNVFLSTINSHLSDLTFKINEKLNFQFIVNLILRAPFYIFILKIYGCVGVYVVYVYDVWLDYK